MLTSLDFLNIGQQFPPLSELERLDMYRKNKALFENEQAIVYSEAFERISRVISNFDEVVSYPVIVNYQKLISLKVADLLFGEPPKIVAGEDDSKEQLTVDTIIKNTNLFNTGYEVSIDLSRYGDGLKYIYKNGDKGQIDVAQPCMWFLVVDPMNIKRIVNHVQAFERMDGEAKYLTVRIHYVGYYIEREYLLEGSRDLGAWRIKAQTKADVRFETGLKDFAIIQVSNIITSDRVHGMDDYSDIDSIISELLVRLGQVARILDKHADPTVTGPMSALQRDAEGQWKLKLGGYIPRDDKNDPEAAYLVWDGQLDANFKMIEQLINFLHAISEMGSHLLGDKNEDGGAVSGTALRFKMISPLAKVKRIAMRFKPALEKAIVLCSQLGGKDIVDLTNTPISITFMDGLPNDPLEESTIMANRTGQKATMSVKRALKAYDGMSEADAENELEAIREDDALANPVPDLLGADPNANPKGGGA